MSESSFPFAGDTTVAAAQGTEVGVPETDRTKVLILGAVAVALVLAVAAYFLLFSGGTEETADRASGRSGSAVVPSAEPAAPEPAAAKPEKISAKSFGRDPFKALIVEAPPAAAAPPVVAPVATDPTTTGGGTSSGGTSAGTTDGISSPAPTSPHSFRVLSVAPDNSTITVNVDGKRYANLRAGEVFATYFKVRLISGASNSFQYGEERFNVLGNKRLTIA